MSNSTPNVVQIYDIGTRFMVDAGQTVPIQSFVDRDRYDVSDLQPNITGYYTVGGKLASMPFNTSMPVLYYNKTMFEKAGLDPDKPPATLDELAADAAKLSAKNGGPAKYGFGAAIYGWFLEQLLATSGDTYCDQGNGRDGLANKAEFDQPDAVTVMTWWQKLVQQGLAANTGRDTKAAQNAFTSQQVAMNLESTGTLSAYSKAAKSGGSTSASPSTRRSAPGRAVRPSAARRCGSTARATATPRRRRPGSSSSTSPRARSRPSAHRDRLLPDQQGRPPGAGRRRLPEEETPSSTSPSSSSSRPRSAWRAAAAPSASCRSRARRPRTPSRRCSTAPTRRRR